MKMMSRSMVPWDKHNGSTDMLRLEVSVFYFFLGENWKPNSINENDVVDTQIHGSFMGQGGEVLWSFKVKGWGKCPRQIQQKLQARKGSSSLRKTSSAPSEPEWDMCGSLLQMGARRSSWPYLFSYSNAPGRIIRPTEWGLRLPYPFFLKVQIK